MNNHQIQHRRSNTSRFKLSLGATVALAFLLTGCTSGGGAPAGSSGDATQAEITFGKVQGAADLVPESIRSTGKLDVAFPTNESPTNYYREGTKELTGVNPDIARLIAGAMGLELVIHVSNFDSIIPGLGADRYDMTVSSMTPTNERMKVLDFVDYMKMGSAIAVPAGNPSKLHIDSLCGKRVAMQTGSYQYTTHVPRLDGECVSRGLDKLVVTLYQDTRQAISALDSQRADVVYSDSAILEYAASQNPGMEIADRAGVSPVGIGVPRTRGLVRALDTAMVAILASPEYQKVLGKYGLEASAVTEARVNVPRS